MQGSKIATEEPSVHVANSCQVIHACLLHAISFRRNVIELLLGSRVPCIEPHIFGAKSSKLSSMVATCSKLAEAIARIDALVEALKSGKLLGTAAAPAPAVAPTSSMPAAPSRPAAAPKPAAPPAAQPAAAAAPKQAKKEKAKASKPAAAAAPAAEEDAFAKAHLAVSCTALRHAHPARPLFSADMHTDGPSKHSLSSASYPLDRW